MTTQDRDEIIRSLYACSNSLALNVQMLELHNQTEVAQSARAAGREVFTAIVRLVTQRAEERES